MSSLSFAEFTNTRCRFQRLNDAKLFNGWILSLTDRAIQITTNSPDGLAVGEEFMVDGTSKKNKVSFRCVLKGVGSMDKSASFRVTNVVGTGMQLMEQQTALYVLQVTSEIRLTPNLESVRLKVDDMAVVFDFEGESVRGIAIDIAEKGVGVILPEPLEKGEQIPITIETEIGPVKAVCKVCYCQQSKDQVGWYRAGLMFTELQRVNAQQWRKLIEKSA